MFNKDDLEIISNALSILINESVGDEDLVEVYKVLDKVELLIKEGNNEKT
jgi:hypothetical protein